MRCSKDDRARYTLIAPRSLDLQKWAMHRSRTVVFRAKVLDRHGDGMKGLTDGHFRCVHPSYACATFMTSTRLQTLELVRSVLKNMHGLKTLCWSTHPISKDIVGQSNNDILVALGEHFYFKLEGDIRTSDFLVKPRREWLSTV